MLDKRTMRLLDALLKICGTDGAYKIVEIAEMKLALAKYKIDGEVLAQMLNFLNDAQMLDIKYSDEAVYCLAILPKGRIYEEEQQVKRHNRLISRSMVALIVFGSFLAAMAGAVVGGVIVGLML